jgi:hypothetical protein
MNSSKNRNSSPSEQGVFSEILAGNSGDIVSTYKANKTV